MCTSDEREANSLERVCRSRKRSTDSSIEHRIFAPSAHTISQEAMTAPCPGSSSFHPDQHDPLCDLPIHAVESPVLLHKQSNTSGLALPRTDLMDDITSQQVLTYKEANRDERQQKTLAGGASNVFPSFSVNSFTRPSGPGQHKGKECTTFALLPVPQALFGDLTYSVHAFLFVLVQAITRKSTNQCSRPSVSSHNSPAFL